jgi:hypothetical protein
MTAIFAGAFWPVVGMGAAFELGKLSAVALLGRRHGGATLGCALVTLVGAFMVLNSIGVYGFLSRARIAQTVTTAARVDRKAADVKARIEVQQSIVDDLDKRLSQLDRIVDASTKRGRTISAAALDRGSDRLRSSRSGKESIEVFLAENDPGSQTKQARTAQPYAH